jgi:hypothetical protein
MAGRFTPVETRRRARAFVVGSAGRSAAVGGFLACRFRWVIVLHLAAACWASVSVLVGAQCPLTGWEDELRRLGRGQGLPDGFIDTYLTGVVYPNEHLRACSCSWRSWWRCPGWGSLCSTDTPLPRARQGPVQVVVVVVGRPDGRSGHLAQYGDCCLLDLITRRLSGGKIVA